MIKTICNKTNGYPHTKTAKTENVSFKVRDETMVSTLSILTQHSVWILSQSNKVKERKKRDTNRKRRSQLSLFADDIILYLKDPKVPRAQALLPIILATWDWVDHGSKPALANSSWDYNHQMIRVKWTGGVAHVVGHLLCKHKALSSIPRPPTQKKKKKI
jgi:hypothetical protein